MAQITKLLMTSSPGLLGEKTGTHISSVDATILLLSPVPATDCNMGRVTQSTAQPQVPVWFNVKYLRRGRSPCPEQAFVIFYVVLVLHVHDSKFKNTKKHTVKREQWRKPLPTLNNGWLFISVIPQEVNSEHSTGNRPLRYSTQHPTLLLSLWIQYSLYIIAHENGHRAPYFT